MTSEGPFRPAQDQDYGPDRDPAPAEFAAPPPPRRFALTDVASEETLKFAALTLVLLSTLAIVALLRPLIFERIVPNVLGTNRVAPAREFERNEGDSAPDPDNANSAPAAGTPGADLVVTEPSPDPSAAAETAIAADSNEDGAQAGDENAATGTEAPLTTPEAATTYIVQPGDNLTAIAARFGVTGAALRAANDLANPNEIFAGQTLVIPAAGP